MNSGEKVYMEVEVWSSAEDPAFVKLLLPEHLEYRFNQSSKPVAIVRKSIVREWQDRAALRP